MSRQDWSFLLCSVDAHPGSFLLWFEHHQKNLCNLHRFFWWCSNVDYMMSNDN